jgi:hypothetical protein
MNCDNAAIERTQHEDHSKARFPRAPASRSHARDHPANNFGNAILIGAQSPLRIWLAAEQSEGKLLRAAQESDHELHLTGSHLKSR